MEIFPVFADLDLHGNQARRLVLHKDFVLDEIGAIHYDTILKRARIWDNSKAAILLQEDDVVDEDDLGSDSDEHIPTQQSVKAYVDSLISDVNANVLSDTYTDGVLYVDKEYGDDSTAVPENPDRPYKTYHAALDDATEVINDAIQDVDLSLNAFVISGDATDRFVVGKKFEVTGSSNNNGVYTTSNSTYDSGSNTTTITVEETISSGTADGTIVYEFGNLIYLFPGTHTLPGDRVNIAKDGVTVVGFGTRIEFPSSETHTQAMIDDRPLGGINFKVLGDIELAKLGSDSNFTGIGNVRIENNSYVYLGSGVRCISNGNNFEVGGNAELLLDDIEYAENQNGWVTCYASTNTADGGLIHGGIKRVVNTGGVQWHFGSDGYINVVYGDIESNSTYGDFGVASEITDSKSFFRIEGNYVKSDANPVISSGGGNILIVGKFQSHVDIAGELISHSGAQTRIYVEFDEIGENIVGNGIDLENTALVSATDGEVTVIGRRTVIDSGSVADIDGGDHNIQIDNIIINDTSATNPDGFVVGGTEGPWYTYVEYDNFEFNSTGVKFREQDDAVLRVNDEVFVKPAETTKLYVDPIQGDDNIAKRGLLNYPFKTLTAAQTEANAGDTIVVFPGTYDEVGLGKDGVDWYFYEGAEVIYTGTTEAAIWDDTSSGANAAISFKVEGYGKFDNQFDSTGSTWKTVVRFSNQSSLHLECNSINGEGTTIYITDGEVTYHIRDFADSRQDSPFYTESPAKLKGFTREAIGRNFYIAWCWGGEITIRAETLNMVTVNAAIRQDNGKVVVQNKETLNGSFYDFADCFRGSMYIDSDEVIGNLSANSSTKLDGDPAVIHAKINELKTRENAEVLDTGTTIDRIYLIANLIDGTLSSGGILDKQPLIDPTGIIFVQANKIVTNNQDSLVDHQDTTEPTYIHASEVDFVTDGSGSPSLVKITDAGNLELDIEKLSVSNALISNMIATTDPPAVDYDLHMKIDEAVVSTPYDAAIKLLFDGESYVDIGSIETENHPAIFIDNNPTVHVDADKVKVDDPAGNNPDAITVQTSAETTSLEAYIDYDDIILAGTGVKLSKSLQHYVVVNGTLEKAIGNGNESEITVTHDFGIRGAGLIVYQNTSPYPEITYSGEISEILRQRNSITIVFDVVPASNEYVAAVSR